MTTERTLLLRRGDLIAAKRKRKKHDAKKNKISNRYL